MLNVLYLIYKQLIDLPILYLSSYIIQNKPAYYKLLAKVREELQWEEWIMYMLDSIEQTANDTIKVIRGIKGLLEQTIERVKSELPKIYSKELIEVLFHQPYCKVNHLVNNGIVARQAAGKYLKQLENIGIIKGEKVGREILYINIELYKLLQN